MNRGLFTENERSAWIFLNQISQLGPIRFHKLLHRARSAVNILNMPVCELQAAEVGIEQAEAWFQAFRNPDNHRQMEREVRLLEKIGAKVVTEIDPEYPEALRELLDRPPVLYYKGSWPQAGSMGIGLVGTRHPTAYGRSVAERLATDLCIQGWATVSGLAEGIDTCVHRATLKANGFTIAVLGCGLGHSFPRQNAALQDEIGAKGIVISEFPFEMPPNARHFPRRNRIISGLSQGVVVIEAAERSGAAITARFAAEQGRDVFAVPGNVFQLMSRGCHRLIKQGAKLVESAADVLEELETPPAAQSAIVPPMKPRPDLKLTECEQSIVNLITVEPMCADQISQKVTHRFDVVASSLLTLELKGIIRMLPGQRYAKT